MFKKHSMLSCAVALIVLILVNRLTSLDNYSVARQNVWAVVLGTGLLALEACRNKMHSACKVLVSLAVVIALYSYFAQTREDQVGDVISDFLRNLQADLSGRDGLMSMLMRFLSLLVSAGMIFFGVHLGSDLLCMVH